jgi:hypothetical protein
LQIKIFTIRTNSNKLFSFFLQGLLKIILCQAALVVGMIILSISEHGNQYFSIYQALGTEQIHVSVEPLELLEPVFLFSLAKFRQLAFFPQNG